MKNFEKYRDNKNQHKNQTNNQKQNDQKDNQDLNDNNLQEQNSNTQNKNYDKNHTNLNTETSKENNEKNKENPKNKNRLPYKIPYAHILHHFPGYLRHLKWREKFKDDYEPQNSLRNTINKIFGEHFYETKIEKKSKETVLAEQKEKEKNKRYNPADKWPDINEFSTIEKDGRIGIRRLIFPFEENKVRTQDKRFKQNVNPDWIDIFDHERISNEKNKTYKEDIHDIKSEDMQKSSEDFSQSQHLNPDQRESIISNQNSNRLVIPPSPNSRNVGNMKKKAMKKHIRQRFDISSANKQYKKERSQSVMVASSLSLPNWNAARLDTAKKILAGRKVYLSRTEIILGCMKAYFPKLRVYNQAGLPSGLPPDQPKMRASKANLYDDIDIHQDKDKNIRFAEFRNPNQKAQGFNHESSQHNKEEFEFDKPTKVFNPVKFISPNQSTNQAIDFEAQLRRTRRQNDRGKYNYKKVSTYCDFEDWDRLQQRCAHARISLSHAVDIALRLYLRGFVEQMLLAGDEMDRKINALLDFGKYQKTVLFDRPQRLEIVYSFDSRSKDGPDNPGRLRKFLYKRYLRRSQNFRLSQFG